MLNINVKLFQQFLNFGIAVSSEFVLIQHPLALATQQLAEELHKLQKA